MVDRLADASTWADRLDVLDHELAGSGSSYGSSPDRVPTLPSEVVWLRRQLEASRGRARVEPLLDETGWSRRHVTERFRCVVGVSPKAYARLCRFEHAASLLDGLHDRPGPSRTLADVAIAAGYYDQSHLTRDFVALAGMTPGSYLAEFLVRPRGQVCPRRRRVRPVTVRE